MQNLAKVVQMLVSQRLVRMEGARVTTTHTVHSLRVAVVVATLCLRWHEKGAGLGDPAPG